MVGMMKQWMIRVQMIERRRRRRRERDKIVATQRRDILAWDYFRMRTVRHAECQVCVDDMGRDPGRTVFPCPELASKKGPIESKRRLQRSTGRFDGRPGTVFSPFRVRVSRRHSTKRMLQHLGTVHSIPAQPRPTHPRSHNGRLLRGKGSSTRDAEEQNASLRRPTNDAELQGVPIRRAVSNAEPEGKPVNGPRRDAELESKPVERPTSDCEQQEAEHHDGLSSNSLGGESTASTASSSLRMDHLLHHIFGVPIDTDNLPEQQQQSTPVKRPVRDAELECGPIRRPVGDAELESEERRRERKRERRRRRKEEGRDKKGELESTPVKGPVGDAGLGKEGPQEDAGKQERRERKRRKEGRDKDVGVGSSAYAGDISLSDADLQSEPIRRPKRDAELESEERRERRRERRRRRREGEGRDKKGEPESEPIRRPVSDAGLEKEETLEDAGHKRRRRRKGEERHKDVEGGSAASAGDSSLDGVEPLMDLPLGLRKAVLLLQYVFPHEPLQQHIYDAGAACNILQEEDKGCPHSNTAEAQQGEAQQQQHCGQCGLNFNTGGVGATASASAGGGSQGSVHGLRLAQRVLDLYFGFPLDVHHPTQADNSHEQQTQQQQQQCHQAEVAGDIGLHTVDPDQQQQQQRLEAEVAECLVLEGNGCHSEAEQQSVHQEHTGQEEQEPTLQSSPLRHPSSVPAGTSQPVVEPVVDFNNGATSPSHPSPEPPPFGSQLDSCPPATSPSACSDFPGPDLIRSSFRSLRPRSTKQREAMIETPVSEQGSGAQLPEGLNLSISQSGIIGAGKGLWLHNTTLGTLVVEQGTFITKYEGECCSLAVGEAKKGDRIFDLEVYWDPARAKQGQAQHNVEGFPSKHVPTPGEHRVILIGRSTEETEAKIEEGCAQVANSYKSSSLSNWDQNVDYTTTKIIQPKGRGTSAQDWVQKTVGLFATKNIVVRAFEKVELIAGYDLIDGVELTEDGLRCF